MVLRFYMFELFTLGIGTTLFILLRSSLIGWAEKENLRRDMAKIRTCPNKSTFVCGSGPSLVKKA
jgi:hypothetical protein